MHRRRAGVAAIKQKNLAQVLKAAITLNKDDFLQSTCSIVLCNEESTAVSLKTNSIAAEISAATTH